MTALVALLPALTLFTFVSSITPGPNNLMLMTSGLNFGFGRTVPHLLGVAIGFPLMVGLVGLGLAQVFVRAPAMLVALKWVGAAYLIHLAVKIARSGAPEPGAAGGVPLTFLQAAAFQWVNPKAWIMAVTACATYTLPDRYGACVLAIAVVSGVVTLPSVSVWVGFGAGLRRWLADPTRLRLFNYTMAALLVVSLYPLITE